MTPQFSLALLLVLITVLAVDLAACRAIKVYDTYEVEIPKNVGSDIVNIPYYRKPVAVDIARRFAWSGPASLAATLGALWIVRRLRSHDATRIRARG
jgi:hypothetical protein